MVLPKAVRQNLALGSSMLKLSSSEINNTKHSLNSGLQISASSYLSSDFHFLVRMILPRHNVVGSMRTSV